MRVQFLPAQILILWNSKVSFSLKIFGIQKLFRIIFFFDKKYQKKLINIFILISLLNQSFLYKYRFFFLLSNLYLVNVLLCLRLLGLIFDFFLVPSIFFKNYLLFGKFSLFLKNIIMVSLGVVEHVSGFVRRVVLCSKPSRQIYVGFSTLLRLTQRQYGIQKQFVLSTSYGLITHTAVIKKKIGGTILFVV